MKTENSENMEYTNSGEIVTTITGTGSEAGGNTQVTAEMEGPAPVRSMRRDGIYDLCSSRKDKILPFPGNSQMHFERLARSFAFEINSNPKLAGCDQLSILQAFYKCCEYGLDPASSLQQTWMIPYGGKIDFQIGYRGWLKLLWNSPMVANVYSHVVYQGDEFEYELGLSPDIRHRPQRGSQDVSELMATYGIVKLKNGEVQIKVCWREEIEQSRKSSRSFSQAASPWNRYFEAMALIVPVRKMAKNLALPLKVEDYGDEDLTVTEAAEAA